MLLISVAKRIMSLGLLAIVLMIMTHATVLAQETASDTVLPVGNADWYYRLGGSSPVLNFSEGLNVRRFEALSGDASWSLDACDFNLHNSVRNHLNDLRRNLYALEKDIVDSAQSLIKISALSVIQRANPALYDLLTRGIANAQVGFDVAVKNCQQMRQDMATGKNPLYGWLNIAAYANWSKADDKADPILVQERINANLGASGIPWVDGQYAGGDGQMPIAITSDVIAAGFQHWSDTANGSNSKTERLSQLWPKAEQAATWAREVLGETRIQFCRNCNPISTEAGVGLQAELARGGRHYTSLLHKLTKSRSRPQRKDLEALSINGMGVGINMAVLQSLRNEVPANRDIFINRLGSEIALADALEKALITRQLLHAGARSHNIANNGEAQKEIQYLLARLQSEVDNVLLEQRLRREVLTGTAQLLLQRANQPYNPPSLPTSSQLPNLP